MKALIRDILIALAIAIAVSCLIRPVIVKETSMEPTLKENNYVIAAKQAYRFGRIEHEDIIVFKSEMDKGKLLIKRVIGLPGDVITISDGVVYRSGKILKEDYIMGGETASTPGEIYNLQVPEGQVFVMGDNRQVSLDSRSDMLGTISTKSIKGKAVFRFYPLSDAGKIH